MKHYSAHLLIAVLLVAALAGCGGGGGGNTGMLSTLAPPISTIDEAREQGTWTILVYLDADNDLESAAIDNFNQMEAIGSTKNVRVVVQMDRIDGYDSSNGNWTDTRRYLVTRDTDANKINSIRMDSPALGERNMADWRTLKDFVEWGTREFPADYYCLIVWDHGSGWEIRANGLTPDYRYVASDDTSGGGMNITEIPSALANVNIDVIAFDACFMQQLEVAYQLRNSASYLVGSASTEPSPGYNYSSLLRLVDANTSPRGLCEAIVKQYADAYPTRNAITQSAVDLSRISEVASATDQLANALINNSAQYADELAAAKSASLNYSLASSGPDRHNYDLLDYASRCSAALGADVGAAYSSLLGAMQSAMVIEIHNSDTPKATGLAIYAPPRGGYDNRYSLLSLSYDTMWDNWLRTEANLR